MSKKQKRIYSGWKNGVRYEQGRLVRVESRGKRDRHYIIKNGKKVYVRLVN